MDSIKAEVVWLSWIDGAGKGSSWLDSQFSSGAYSY